MIFALELTDAQQLSVVDYLEVGQANSSVFDMGLGWQYLAKTKVLLYFLVEKENNFMHLLNKGHHPTFL